jgi:hypothetical protein
MITPESDVGLAQEEGDADTEQHRGDADGDVVDPGEAANRAVHAPSAAPAKPAAETPTHGLPL